MAVTDQIADMLTRIRNANLARQEHVLIPASKLKLELAKVLKGQGYIQKYDLVDDKRQGQLPPALSAQPGAGDHRAAADQQARGEGVRGRGPPAAGDGGPGGGDSVHLPGGGDGPGGAAAAGGRRSALLRLVGRAAMSRVGKAPVPLPAGVTAELSDHQLTVRGPQGELTRGLPEVMGVVVEGGAIRVSRPSESREHRALHGLTRSLVANMVQGVSQGYGRVLELYGVGYRVQQQGQRLTLQLGYSHAVVFDLPEGIGAQVESFVPTLENGYLSVRLTLRGIDKELLGLTAARLRDTRKPEPYKGKGFRYQGERIRRKAGKAAQTASQ
jgi:large subunit ribosomal protein L6